MFNGTPEITDKVGEALCNNGIIDHATLEKALLIRGQENGRKRRSIAQILVQDLKLDHDVIFSHVAAFYAFRHIRFAADDLSAEEIENIRDKVRASGSDLRDILIEKRIFPFCSERLGLERFILVACDPTAKELISIENLLNISGCEAAYISPGDFDLYIKTLYPPENQYLKNLEVAQPEFSIIPDDVSLDESLLEKEVNKSALINLFEGALLEGVRKGASDIHIVPLSSTRTAIHFRIDGRLTLWHTQENVMPEAIIAVVKDRSRGFDRFEREKAQDGYIQREIDSQLIRFRVSILPLSASEIRNKFESVVIRILDDRKVITDLNELGLTGYARQAFENAIRRPQGLVILTGPTGSGKSTTLVAALHQVITPQVNVLTVEDPVEYAIRGARQLKISHKMNFELALRSILRHDPDIVLVGEIRDAETADIAIKLANTGHLTFTTLHTNDAASAISRLYKMKIEPFLLAYAINIIVAQRLIRRLCPDCKTAADGAGSDYMKYLDTGAEDSASIYQPAGCDKCGYTGYKGRIAIHEAISFTKQIRQIIFSSGEEIDEEKIREEAKKDGSITLRESGIEKVRLGLTSLEEVLACTMDS